MCADAYVNFANGCVLVLNLLFFQTTSSLLAYELILLSVSFVFTDSAYGWHWLLKQYLSCTAVLAHNCFLEHMEEGIEVCHRFEFEYKKSKYNAKHLTRNHFGCVWGIKFSYWQADVSGMRCCYRGSTHFIMQALIWPS